MNKQKPRHFHLRKDFNDKLLEKPPTCEQTDWPHTSSNTNSSSSRVPETCSMKRPLCQYIYRHAKKMSVKIQVFLEFFPLHFSKATYISYYIHYGERLFWIFLRQGLTYPYIAKYDLELLIHLTTARIIGSCDHTQGFTRAR